MKRVAVCFAFMALLACASARNSNAGTNGSSQSEGDSPPPPPTPPPPPPPPPSPSPPPPSPSPPPPSPSPPPPSGSNTPPPQSFTSTPSPPPPSPPPPSPPPPETSTPPPPPPPESSTTSPPPPPPESSTTPPPPPSPSSPGGQTSPQLQTEEKNVLNKVPKDVVGGDTNVDTSAVQTVNSSLQQHANDPKSGSQALNSALSSANAVSVSKGFSFACVNNPSSASAYTESFAQLCINAANSGNPVYATKTVASFSLSIVFLVVTGNVAVAKTCASAFTSYIISAGGCSEFVVVIIQTFIQITVSLTTRTSVTIFG